MSRKPATRSQRIAALALEAVGALAVLYAVAGFSVPLALALAGVLAVVAAQFLGEML